MSRPADAAAGARASVIVVTFNGAAYLERCLAALRPELGRRDEIVVVDNASRDGSVPLLRALAPEATVIENRVNRGFAAACNQGADAARGGVLVFLNQDTEVQAGWLENLLGALDDGGRESIATSRMVLLSRPDTRQGTGVDVHYSGISHPREFLRPHTGAAGPPHAVGAVCGGACAVSRDLWSALGGFDETFFAYHEDTDFSWRARLAGHRSLAVPGSVVLHDLKLDPSPRTVYLLARNRWLVILKNWRWRTLALLLPGLAVADVAEWGYALCAGWRGLLGKARAAAWILGHWRGVRQAHRRTQALRSVPDWVILGERERRIAATRRTGGPVGRAALRFANLLLDANGRFAARLCRRFGW